MATLMGKMRTVFRQPGLLPEYVGWLSQKPYRANPVRRYHGVKISGFSDFSEYHSFTAMLDSAERAFLARVAPGIASCVDVGANIGAWSLHLASLNDRMRIFAFEADRYTYLSQLYNITLNANDSIHPFNYAIGDEITLKWFAANPRSRATQSFAAAGTNNAVPVHCTTLDAFTGAGLVPASIDFLKIDVEGYEELVLRGARDVLARQRAKIVFFEHCPELIRRAGLALDAPLELLRGAGYEITEIKPGGALAPLEAPGYVLKNLVALSPAFAATPEGRALRSAA